MKQVLVRGKMYDVRDGEYLQLVDNLARGYQVLANSYHHYHSSGFADLNHTLSSVSAEQDESNKKLIEQIDDHELLDLFRHLLLQIQAIKQIDKEIITWLAAHLGLPAVKNKKDEALLKRRLKKLIVNEVDGPVWVLQPGYQQIMKRSNEVMESITKTQSRIEERIQKLLK